MSSGLNRPARGGCLGIWGWPMDNQGMGWDAAGKVRFFAPRYTVHRMPFSK